MTIDAETLNRIKKYAWYLYHRNYWSIWPYDYDDIQQEICCRLVDKYDGERSIDGFVVFTGSKVVADMNRAMHGRDKSTKWTELKDWTPDPVNDYDRADHEIDVWTMTKDRRKARDREILNRFFLAGESQVEIGERFGCTGSRINQILKRLCGKVEVMTA